VRRRLASGLAALFVALGAGGPLAGCGDDEEGEDAETTITTEPTEDAAIVPEDPGPAPPEEPDTDQGGTVTPVVPDDGHEGGGPDPGTEEAEQAPEASGGTGPGDDPTNPANAGNGDPSPGGQSPPEAYEQFCEQKPEACE